MTESDWLTCTDPQPMLKFLRGQVSDRKMRLFACASCRRVLEFSSVERLEDALKIVENYADGLANDKDREAILEFVEQLAEEASLRADLFGSYTAEAIAVAASIHRFELWDGSWSIPEAYIPATYAVLALTLDTSVEGARHCDLLRDIIGNPLRPGTEIPRTPNTQALAQAAYDEREPPSGLLDRVKLAILADALEEATADQQILDHLRGPGSHVRGCHVVDSVLGKK